jgi:dolichyl-diphosphooligosaccharide--protein glycosyltransferase
MSDVSAIPTQDEVGLIERGVNFNRRTVVERTLRNSGIVDAYIDGNDSDQAQQRAILEAQRSLAGTNPAWTKTFERVEGATINGEGPANSTIELAVDIEPENGQPFVYEQQVETDTSGDFTATVPYSTTGYDEVDVDDGYTNVSARANSSYRISTPGIIEEDGQFVQYSTTADVSEQQVIGKDNSPVEVELERQVVFDEGDLPDNGPEETGANETDGGTETDGETADETEPDGQTETSDQNDSTESLDDRSGSGTAEIERIRIRQQ